MGLDRGDLGRTVPAEAWAPAAASPPPERTATSDAAAPASDRMGVAERLSRLGYPLPPGARLEVGETLGMGATGQVFAGVDRDLERPVAIKLLAAPSRPTAEEVAGFLAEARITASLEHPNVLPVHELEVTADGRLFFTMKRVDGASLGAALARSTPQRREPPLDDVNTLASVFIGVCQALAYAHRRRIVHQDVKPDNIMLGEFGEVLLVDWGSARRLDAPGGALYGTPLYMSPEQARGERADERSDVYCLGATMFHALTARLPAWNDDVDRFLALKRSGGIAPPTADERARVPAALLAIALKALAPDPAARYRDAGALLEDLRRYQGGLAVSALRESGLQRLRRWHRRNARAFWSWSTAAAVVIALAAALCGERLEQMARWGRPRVESFADGSWQQRWVPLAGSFIAQDGRLVSQAGRSMLTLRQRLSGAAAIEYDGEVLPGSAPADVSLLWSRDAEFSSDGTRVTRLIGSHAFKIGAWDGAFTSIGTWETNAVPDLAVADFRPQAGQRFHVRAEIEDNRLRLWIDGRELCTWADPFSLEGGYLSLWAEGSGKAYSDLRIYSRIVPAKVPATAIGDEAARAGNDDPRAYDIAAEAYARVADSHPGSALGEEATYKLGLCRWRQGRQEEALLLWDTIAAGAYAADIRLYRLERAFDAGHHDEVLTGLAELGAASDPDARALAALQWTRWMERLHSGGDRALIERYLDLHDRVLARERIADQGAADTLFFLDRGDELLQRYPSERHLCAQVLAKRGEFDRIIRDYHEQRWDRSSAAFFCGEWDEIDPDSAGPLAMEAKWARGRGAELADDPAVPDLIRARGLFFTGRAEEALAFIQASHDGSVAQRDEMRVRCLIALGRLDEAAAIPGGAATVDFARGTVERFRDDHTPTTARFARALLAIRARTEGRADETQAALAERTSPNFVWPPYAVDSWILLPLIRGIDGDGFAAFDAACAELRGRWRYTQRQLLSYLADYAAAAIDDRKMLDQPCGAWAKANLELGRALRAERRGERDAALAAWRAWLAFPIWERSEDTEGGARLFAEWRVRELSAPSAR
jgi:hypothetical protein